jgi:hypothetical protein
MTNGDTTLTENTQDYQRERERERENTFKSHSRESDSERTFKSATFSLYSSGSLWNPIKTHHGIPISYSLDLVELVSLDNWVGLGNSFLSCTSVVKGALVLVRVPVSPTEHVPTFAIEACKPNPLAAHEAPLWATLLCWCS